MFLDFITDYFTFWSSILGKSTILIWMLYHFYSSHPYRRAPRRAVIVVSMNTTMPTSTSWTRSVRLHLSSEQHHLNPQVSGFYQLMPRNYKHQLEYSIQLGDG